MTADIVKNMSLTIRDKVSVSSENNKIIIEPIKAKQVFNIPSDYKAVESINDNIAYNWLYYHCFNKL